jgi:class 3 adenylate cyclase/tetratricopeptide (TPR) repeat protein
MSATPLDDLREDLVGGQAVVVVGAGVSMAATGGASTASWVGLLNDGVTFCEALLGPSLPPGWAERRRAQVVSGDLEELVGAAEDLTRRLGGPAGGEFGRWLAGSIGKLRVTKPAVLEGLAALRVPLATTNYDGLLEAGTGRSAVTWRQSALFEQVLRGDYDAILHLHGHWQDPESVVLGVRSYEVVVGNTHAEAMRKALASTRTLVFVGCGAGLDDPNFGALRRWLAGVFAGSPHRHYRLCLRQGLAELWREHGLDARIVQVAYGERHEDLAPFLQRLVDPTTTGASASQATSAIWNVSLPPNLHFTGKEDVLAGGVSRAARSGPRAEERKRVSVLFCDLVDFTSRAEHLDVEDVRGLLVPYYQRLRHELERHGGTVEKFIGDAVMALFGAPIAHEDDPERAVRAALAVREAITELDQASPVGNLHIRVGVTTGEALVVVDARPSRGEGMASGDVVNTAARLQVAAPVDGILVDEATWQATSRRIVYREAEPVQAKGKAALVWVWEAVEPIAWHGADVARLGRTPLVGRTRELGMLRGGLERAREEDTPQFVTLVGVPGIGKSRLVWELLQLVETEPQLTTWRQGRCLPYGEGVALGALAEVVKAQAGILETDPAEQATAKLEHAVAALIDDQSEAARVTAHLTPLVGLADAARPVEDRRADTFAAWRHLLEAMAEQRQTVLVFEDLHWADEVFLDFLDYLVEWVADVPLLVVVTARPELLDRRPSWGGGKPNSTIVSLTPLSDVDTARLVDSLLERTPVPDELRTTLATQTGGNPLYAEEYVRMLADRGALRQVGGTQPEQIDELPMPETVEGIIAARLDTLPPEQKALVADAAVLGRVSWLGALAALAGTESILLEEGLHLLERREFLRRERRSAVAGEREYAFRHVLVRDVAYSQLPRAVRAAKHRRAAEWIQRLSPDRAQDRAALVAYHYAAALAFARAAGQATGDLVDRARLALRDAGDHASRVGAHPIAARFYTEALAIWPPDDPERPDLELRAGEACCLGEGTGEDLLASARDGLLARGDRERAAQAEARLGQLAYNRGEERSSHLDRALALVADAPPSHSKAVVLSYVMMHLLVADRNADAIQVAREGLAMARSLGDRDGEVAALGTIGAARVNLGDPGGLADLERCIALCQADGSSSVIPWQSNLAFSYALLGDLRRCFAAREAAWELAEQFGSAVRLRWLEIERVGECYWSGRWDQAVQIADALAPAGEDGAPHYMKAMCHLWRGRIQLARGQLGKAQDDAGRALALARESGDRLNLDPALAFGARVLLAADQTADAGKLLDELLATLGGRLLKPELGVDLAVDLVALGHYTVTLDTVLPSPWLEAARAFVVGDALQAADGYARIGSRPDEAWVRLHAARQLMVAGRSAEAGAQLEPVLAFYREVGASTYLAEATALTPGTRPL